MLERVHRTGVDIQVRVEFLHDHLKSAMFQEGAKRRTGEAFSERTDNTASNKNILHRIYTYLAPEHFLHNFHVFRPVDPG